MTKIVIIGAGIGGLVVAEILGRNGYEVDLYEKLRESSIGYEWYDELDERVFHKTKIPIIDEKYYFDGDSWAFIAPDRNDVIKLDSIKGEKDISIYRKELARHLIERAKKYAKLHFNTPVDCLFIEDDIVKGIIINNKVIKASLVIDSSGALSKFRQSLPTSYFIQKEANKNEIISLYKGIYKELPRAEELPHKKKVYIKHLGENNISWSVVNPDKTVDILIGKIGEINEAEIKKAFKDLCNDNKYLSDELLKAGKIYKIPTRYPLSKMVGINYVAIGDAAFMTLPIHGSGIACSMMAGTILGNTIVNCEPNQALSVTNLWQYQVEYYKEYGIRYCASDIYKRWIIFAKMNDINWIIKHKVIDKNDISRIFKGELVNLSTDRLIRKIKYGYKNIPLLLQLLRVVILSNKAISIAKKIPTEYNEKKVNIWSQKLDNFFGKLYKQMAIDLEE